MNRSFLGRQNGLGPGAHRVGLILGDVQTDDGIVERYGEVTDQSDDEFHALRQDCAFRILYLLVSGL